MNSDIAQLASLAHSQISHQQPEYQQHDDSQTGQKRQAEEGAAGASKAKRSRYISLACNECKRRKIKCNGQTPCQRCGNLSLDCIYTPNCCNGFKDSQEYKEMSGHIASLQEQVNALYENLNALRIQLGHAMPAPQLQAQQQQTSAPQTQYVQTSPSIDPSLQSYQQSYNLDGQELSPQSSMRRQSQTRQFRGLTSADFNFGVAKNTLQAMGIDATPEEAGGRDEEYPLTVDVSHGKQLLDTVHEMKDPIWTIPKAEAERLCRVYDEEMSVMYPLVDMQKLTAYIQRLFPFLEAMHRSGLMQQGLPGADAVEDDDTNILKLVMATALTIEGAGRSELGQRLFERVQPSVDKSLLGDVSTKGIRLLVMTALYQFQRDDEGAAWRLIGLAARLCIELGLHKQEAYDAITDEVERNETMLLFWACYVLDRRWSLGTGMLFALQDQDLDPMLPKPGDRSPYLTAMIKYSEIGSRVWRSLAAPPSAENGGISPINIEEMDYLEYQVLQWHRNVPAELQFEHPFQGGRKPDSSADTPGLRSQVVIYLRANQMRILILRPVLHSATSITTHREHADKIVEVAKDTIRILTWMNENTDLYRRQQVVFHAYMTSALAVLFLSFSHTPAFYAASVKDEFYMATNLVRDLSKGSFVSRRLWRTIKTLKDIAPTLGLACETQQQLLKQDAGKTTQQSNELDPSRSAAMAMAGLAGHPVDESALVKQNGAQSESASIGTSPEYMAMDLSFMYEVAGGTYGEDQTGTLPAARMAVAEHPQLPNTIGMTIGEDEISNVMKDLF